jgi:predicted DNA-binding transcriptional regulator AlpA
MEGDSMTEQEKHPTKATRSLPSTRRDHMTVADLCAELGIARSTFYDWRQAKKAPRCIKLPNGDLRIRRSDYAAWLENLEDAA